MRHFNSLLMAGVLVAVCGSFVYANPDLSRWVAGRPPASKATEGKSPAPPVRSGPTAKKSEIQFKAAAQPISEPIQLIGAEAPLSDDMPVVLISESAPLSAEPLPLLAAAAPIGPTAPEQIEELPPVLKPAHDLEMAQATPVRRPRVGAPSWMKIAPAPLSENAPSTKRSATAVAIAPHSSAPVLQPTATTTQLAQLSIPLKDGSSVGAERLLQVQQRIWYWKGGAVRRRLASFINVLLETQSLEQAAGRSGLSLNEVQYLLSKST
ncbi:hypothetical protein [Gloeobacter kilaueensis]|nr:hypothetical protein [Gloeobacter kilaueensis]